MPAPAAGLERVAGAFHAFCQVISQKVPGMFTTARSDESGHARRYLSGLVSGAPRKNMERMNERLAPRKDDDYEAMQHFLSGSPWEERKVYDFIAARADERLGGRPDTLLTFDESAFGKKGRASVGVARQHNGRLGKQDNCQVGVFSVLSCGSRSALVGTRLFLPDEWAQDAERCGKAGVPEGEIQTRTKIDLARELMEQADEQKLRYACVTMDAFYGRDSRLLEWLEGRGATYCADVPANALVFETKPSGKQRPEKMVQSAQRVDVLAAKWALKKGTMVNLREGENGLVCAQMWARRVWVWPAQRQEPRACWLVVRRTGEGTLKPSLSNAPESTRLERLAQWQGGRFFIEQSFKDGKSHVGMGQYQARGWRAWHHHMAMVALALLFVMEQRMLLEADAPLLSAGDIVELLDWHLARPRTSEQAVAAVKARHRQRERNALNAQNRVREQAGLPKIRKMRLVSLPK